MADPRKAWLKLHAAGEKLLTRKLRAYFRDQAARVVGKIEDLGLSAGVASQAIDVADEHAKLQAALAEPIIGMMGTAAEGILKQAAKPKSAKAFDSDALKNFKLPQWVQEEIERAFVDLEGRDYWQEIQKSTANSVADAVQEAIEQGMSMQKAAKYLKDNFAFSPTRAAAIARTETTGAYNLGHQASYDFLHQSGEIAGKEWLAVIDQDTREEHAEADGQIVPVNEPFTVGGESIDYPGGDCSAGNRVNCRCTTAGVFE